ncbi:MAG: efflux RND transporter periplasmic adaptor subunit [Vicinamibacterales bacterium]
MKRRTLALLALGIVIAGGAAFTILRRGPARVTVDTGTVTRQAQFRSTVTASGEIVASRYADIGSSVMGKIVSLPVAEGDRVRAGQVLAQIDRVQAQSDAASATEQTRALESDERAAQEQVRATEADVAAAEARLRDANQVLKRRQELRAEQLVAAADLDAAAAAADAATAQVAAARAAVDRARQNLETAARRVSQSKAQQRRAADVLEKTSIPSPIDGVVTRLRVRNGEMVVVGVQNQPGTTLMTISDLGAIDTEVKVAEADVLRVAVGQKAEVTLEALPGKRFAGKVVEIGASALPVTGTAAAREFRVVIRLDAPDAGLRPGLTGDAEIVTSERTNVQTVPLQSVVLRTIDGQSRTGVFTVDATGVARFTPVTSGTIGGLDIEVAGLQDGTRVVTGPYQVLRELKDGALVTVPGTK